MEASVAVGLTSPNRLAPLEAMGRGWLRTWAKAEFMLGAGRGAAEGATEGAAAGLGSVFTGPALDAVAAVAAKVVGAAGVDRVAATGKDNTGV